MSMAYKCEINYIYIRNICLIDYVLRHVYNIDFVTNITCLHMYRETHSFSLARVPEAF